MFQALVSNDHTQADLNMLWERWPKTELGEGGKMEQHSNGKDWERSC